MDVDEDESCGERRGISIISIPVQPVGCKSAEFAMHFTKLAAPL